MKSQHNTIALICGGKYNYHLASDKKEEIEKYECIGKGIIYSVGGKLSDNPKEYYFYRLESYK